MVAMSIVVAAFVPSIRLSMAIAFILGTGLAVVLIAVRRRQGPLPSGKNPGAHMMLPLEPPHQDDPHQPGSRLHCDEMPLAGLGR
jgi:hypothetical protein